MDVQGKVSSQLRHHSPQKGNGSAESVTDRASFWFQLVHTESLSIIRFRVWVLSQQLLRVIYLCWQKEEDGEILNSLGHPETTFEQSGLGPGQEYEVKLEVVKNNKRGPPASKSVITSEWTFQECSKSLRGTPEKNLLWFQGSRLVKLVKPAVKVNLSQFHS